MKFNCIENRQIVMKNKIPYFVFFYIFHYDNQLLFSLKVLTFPKGRGSVVFLGLRQTERL